MKKTKGSSIDSSFCQIMKTAFPSISLSSPGHDWCGYFDETNPLHRSVLLFCFSYFLCNYILTCNYYTEGNFSAVCWFLLLLFHFRGNVNEILGAKQNFRLAEVLKLIPANSNMFRITRFAKLVLWVILLVAFTALLSFFSCCTWL